MICCLNPNCEKPLNGETSSYCENCGNKLSYQILDRFQIKKPIGQGGFGRTYLAEDIHNFGDKCVVKQLIYPSQGTQVNQKIVELFMREAKQLQQLRKNQQIPNLVAYFELDGYLYLVQELIDGEDLQKELRRQGIFDENKIRQLLTGILPVLDFIHERGVIHRDLKPSNIMRRCDSHELILIDFGVSKQLSKKLTTICGVTTVGTNGYAPYEQMNEEETRPQPSSDLFSLGATCFQLMTDIYPGDLWARQGYGWCENWEQYIKQPISTELKVVLTKMLKFDVHDRYQEALDILKALSIYKLEETVKYKIIPSKINNFNSSYKKEKNTSKKSYLKFYFLLFYPVSIGEWIVRIIFYFSSLSFIGGAIDGIFNSSLREQNQFKSMMIIFIFISLFMYFIEIFFFNKSE